MENTKTLPLKTHWKKLHNPDYLRSWDFQPNEEKILTIKKVASEGVRDQSGKKEECSVCHFTENTKPMVLNVTNSKSITKVAESPYIEDWANCKVQLFVTEVKAFGDIMEAVRVRPIKPTVKKPELKANTRQFDNAIKHLEKGGTIDNIKQHYQVSEAIVEILKEKQNA